ncbi:MAG TPA: hypothetical protein PLE45_05955 [Spirochaetota bacterium]|nr:hypothetical protein [Spirochaetota bacterium]HOL56815.1 hypothetical protein [Spirochaetota bacterium]HPP04237.1 hypothetical protein [Spirochaetota bacterium]
MKYVFRKYNFIIFLLLFLLGCATNEKEEEKPIVIEKIELFPSINRTPRMNFFQTDIEIVAKMSADNLNQDIFYEWFIEEIKLDIQSNLDNIYKEKDKIKYKENIKDLSNDTAEDSTNDKESREILEKISSLQKEKKKINYYLYTSKNPLNCMISIFEPGYYKITLRATNTKEVKEKSLILKVGEPELPELFLKLNIPDINTYFDNSNDNDNTNDKNISKLKGKIFVKFESLFDKENKKDFIKIEGENFINGWYNTKIKVNPFYSFKITAGTHIVEGDDNILYIASLNKIALPAGYDNIYFDFLDKKANSVLTSPITLKNFDKNNIFTIYKKGTKKWKEGDIFLTYLMWGFNNEKKEEFIIFENMLNEANKSITTYLDNKFLVKVYIGSIGIRSRNNDFFIFFSPDGLDTDEFDTKKTRDFPGLPFGYLIGKLGENGKEFPVGSGYSYLSPNNIPIFYLDQFGKYAELKENGKNSTINK